VAVIRNRLLYAICWPSKETLLLTVSDPPFLTTSVYKFQTILPPHVARREQLVRLTTTNNLWSTSLPRLSESLNLAQNTRVLISCRDGHQVIKINTFQIGHSSLATLPQIGDHRHPAETYWFRLMAATAEAETMVLGFWNDRCRYVIWYPVRTDGES
jgi:hypothetical protein